MLINPLLDMAAVVVELVVMVTICSVVLSMLLLPSDSRLIGAVIIVVVYVGIF